MVNLALMTTLLPRPRPTSTTGSGFVCAMSAIWSARRASVNSHQRFVLTHPEQVAASKKDSLKKQGLKNLEFSQHRAEKNLLGNLE
jgi:hypothetical protein